MTQCIHKNFLTDYRVEQYFQKHRDSKMMKIREKVKSSNPDDKLSEEDIERMAVLRFHDSIETVKHMMKTTSAGGGPRRFRHGRQRQLLLKESATIKNEVFRTRMYRARSENKLLKFCLHKQTSVSFGDDEVVGEMCSNDDQGKKSRFFLIMAEICRYIIKGLFLFCMCGW